MTVVHALLLVVAGLVAGVIAGLVGVGGGIIFTPVLFGVFGLLEVPSGVQTPLTVGTGLFCTGIAAGASALHHFRRGAVRLDLAAGVGVASAGAVGLVSGLVVTKPWYDASLFQALFAFVLLVVVVRMVRGPSGVQGPSSESAGGWGRWILTGSAAGAVASAVGVGGGVILVPAYNRFLGRPLREAVGTSSATILVISAVSAVAYGLLGSGISGRPPLSLGYVDVGTGLLLAAPAVLGARAGVALAHRFDPRWLRWGFAALGAIVAGRLLWNALGFG